MAIWCGPMYFGFAWRINEGFTVGPALLYFSIYLFSLWLTSDFFYLPAPAANDEPAVLKAASMDKALSKTLAEVAKAVNRPAPNTVRLVVSPAPWRSYAPDQEQLEQQAGDLHTCWLPCYLERLGI